MDYRRLSTPLAADHSIAASRILFEFNTDPTARGLLKQLAQLHDRLMMDDADPLQAKALLTHAIQISPAEFPLWWKLGQFHKFTSAPDEAIGVYSKAVGLQRERRRQALANAAQAGDDGSSHVAAAFTKKLQAEIALVYMAMGDVYNQHGRYEEALGVLKQAFAADPTPHQEDSNVRIMMIESMIQTGDLTEAVTEARRYLKQLADLRQRNKKIGEVCPVSL